MIKDLIGNSVREGNMLLWTKTGLIVKVKEISNGGLSIPGTKELTPAKMTVEIEFPFKAQDDPKLFTCFNEFIRVVNPQESVESEARTDRVLEIVGNGRKA